MTVRGDVAANPVPRGLPTRRERSRPSQGVPLVRASRTLPRILAPAEVDALTTALRTHRDRAMVSAMLLGGLRRCEVLGLRLGDVNAGDRQLFVADGKGGHQRLVPVSPRFFEHLGAYLDTERPAGADTDQVFLVLKRPNRGRALSAKGLEQVLASARDRGGLTHGSCHELRHTCLTRLREAGMALEAVQAQAGHASIESTRIYLHLADDWLASQYRRAAEVIDAQVYAGAEGSPRRSCTNPTRSASPASGGCDENHTAATVLPDQHQRGGAAAMATWAQVEVDLPAVAATMRAYLDQIAVVLRPGSVDNADLCLRSFATYLLGHHREVTCVRDIARTHIEGYKPWLAARPDRTSPQPHRRPSPTASGRCGCSSCASRSGPGRTHHRGSRCSPATCPSSATPCPRHSMTTPRPPCSKQPRPTGASSSG